ncbi:MAG: putative sulfate exporter family transporter [Planctomycetota bacterium]|nr:putative sulfate exporter family transporter [Planctomycetota bacterium]
MSTTTTVARASATRSSSPALDAARWSAGLALLASISIAAWWLHRWVPNLPLPPTTLFLGVAAGSAFALAPGLRDVRPATDVPLAVGMVLLGSQCDVEAARTVGFVGIALLLAHWFTSGVLVRLALGFVGESRREASLVSVGLTGCGISAVLAAEESDPSSPPRARLLAVAATLIAGTTGFVLMPLVGAWLGLGSTEVARWAGIAMPTTAEAVLVGGAHSLEALRGTGAFRFVVNILQWIPVLGHARRFAAGEEGTATRSIAHTAAAVARRVPPFVWGLAVVAAIAASDGFASEERVVLSHVTNWAFLMALAGVGFSIRPLAIAKLGWRPITAAVAGWLLGAALLLAAVVATGS